MEYDNKKFDLYPKGHEKADQPARPPKPNRVLSCSCEQAEEVQDSGYIIWQTIKFCQEHDGPQFRAKTAFANPNAAVRFDSSLAHMLQRFRIQQESTRHISFLRCHWCHKHLSIGSLATKDEYKTVYCNNGCFDGEVDQEMRLPNRPLYKFSKADKTYLIENE